MKELIKNENEIYQLVQSTNSKDVLVREQYQLAIVSAVYLTLEKGNLTILSKAWGMINSSSRYKSQIRKYLVDILGIKFDEEKNQFLLKGSKKNKKWFTKEELSLLELTPFWSYEKEKKETKISFDLNSRLKRLDGNFKKLIEEAEEQGVIIPDPVLEAFKTLDNFIQS
jgi:hypothetical protein